MIVWDEQKRKQVIKEHGVDFAKIEDLFDDPFGVFNEDVAHSTKDEIRFAVIGQTAHYGLIYAAYVYEGEFDLRFITARRAENWMVRTYETNRKRL